MGYQLPKQPIRISRQLLHDPEIDEIMSDPISRAIYLLWRPNHMVGPDFNQTVRNVALQIMEIKPKTPEELHICFGRQITIHEGFQCTSLRPFCEQAFPYIMGEKKVEMEILE